MKHKETMSRILSMVCVLAIVSSPTLAWSNETDELAQQEQALQEEAKRPAYVAALKERYNLTDEQIKALQDQGMNHSQITIAAQLAASSEKPIDEITKMRLEQKMGWGKIAKELGLHPSEIGKGVSGMHRRDDKAERVEKAASKQEKMKERQERRAEKREKQAEKKQEKAERRMKRDKV